ncbi:hypothetical protein DKE52_019380 [Acinetobacter pittii]|uniref:Uncharacterized protein n=1 Tax=Acinetobacter pittii TaxID=48296 RepID=A0A3G6YM18_ACIPI|nr:hypothetical protein DKE52_019380 [Acinetobacter pittii]
MRFQSNLSSLIRGEQWTFSAQELYMSHNDFNSLSILLIRASEKGEFSITRTQHTKPWVGTHSVTLTKH